MIKERLGISGKIASGKTTASEYAVGRYGYKRVSLAAPLKEVANWWKAYSTTNLDDEGKLDLKNHLYKFLSEKLYFKDHSKGNKAFDLLIEQIFPKFPDIDWSVEKNDKWRQLLQDIGQGFRSEVDPDTWVRYLVNTLEPDGHYICDDVRYQNEYYIMEEAGFTVVRLHVSPEVQAERVLKQYGVVDPLRLTHSSETNLDGITFPYNLNADEELPKVLHDLTQLIEKGCLTFQSQP